MKIVIATDKFKGSLSSFAACNAIGRGLLQASAAFNIIKVPLSDGGDGWLDVMAQYTTVRKIVTTVADPLFRPVQAHYLLSEDGSTAFIEMAQASGLLLLQPAERNPLRTTTFGTGELIRDAMQHGVSKIILGIGGSATNDCGIGMAAALGYRFLDAQGRELLPVGENLAHICAIDDSNKITTGAVKIEVACDVTNQLTGVYGATKVYAPQKGATPEIIEQLEKGVQQFVMLVKQWFGIDMEAIKSGGAAGGMGAGGLVFLGATLISGIQLLLAYSGAEKYIKEADLIITGEGALDAQTAQGKAVQGVIDISKKWQKPVVALCGAINSDASVLQKAGLTAAFSIINQPMTLEAAMQQTETLLTAAACNLGNFLKTAYHLK